MSSSSSRSYSKECRSYYSRSSSNDNNRWNSSSRNRRLVDNDRPLSSLLTEQDFPSRSRALDWIDDPYFFQNRLRKFSDDFDRRLRYRFNDDFFDDPFFKSDFKTNSFDVGRNIPINYRGYDSSSSTARNIPVQYTPSSPNHREKVYKKIDNNEDWASSSFQHNNESFQGKFDLLD